MGHDLGSFGASLKDTGIRNPAETTKKDYTFLNALVNLPASVLIINTPQSKISRKPARKLLSFKYTKNL